jgi:hypothetical protein
LSTLNLTAKVEDGIVDLDRYCDIRQNYITIDTSYFFNLQKPVLLSLYGLSFTNPRILRDGVLCSSPDCNIVSYIGGRLVFNTTVFSVSYAAEETPSSPPAQPPGGGGSGGSSSGGGSRVIQGGTEVIYGEATGKPSFIINDDIVR